MHLAFLLSRSPTIGKLRGRAQSSPFASLRGTNELSDDLGVYGRPNVAFSVSVIDIFNSIGGLVRVSICNNEDILGRGDLDS
jgi:hypothetical protein